MTLREVRAMPLGERIYNSLLYAMGLYPRTVLTKLVFTDNIQNTEVACAVYNEANGKNYDYCYRFPKKFQSQIPVFIDLVHEEFGADIDIEEY